MSNFDEGKEKSCNSEFSSGAIEENDETHLIKRENRVEEKWALEQGKERDNELYFE